MTYNEFSGTLDPTQAINSQALVCFHVRPEFQTKTAAAIDHVLCISANDVHVYQKARCRHLGDRSREL